MVETGLRNPQASLKDHGIEKVAKVNWNLTAEELVEATIKRDMGILSDRGAICVNTGRFTGRSPKDRYIVLDEYTSQTVDWNDINIPFDPQSFSLLKAKMVQYLSNKEVYAREAYVCSDKDFRLNLRLITEYPWSNQFGFNMFLRPTKSELEAFQPEWAVICAPGFEADPKRDGTRSKNFAIINFSEKTIIIGGTAYTGEIKKGIFSALNFILPHEREVLSMHCSANVGSDGDTTIFFGLSGTGKTTLSADPNRQLIGDDEHGWSDKGVFNFEGGCYAKCIHLSESAEPQIYHAIKHGAILENIGFYSNSRIPDFDDESITQNTRVSYPIYHINNAIKGSKGGHPENIFFLTCDAFGVLPPISKLSPGQAMYHFISGYTAKVAGTEDGIIEPKTTFSACFGAPFLPLHPTTYAEMLGEKMKNHKVNVWLINTGWTGGAYGTGNRINLKFTRAMIKAAMEGELNNVNYREHEVFGLKMPESCPGVPVKLLNPVNTWSDANTYQDKANELAACFLENFKKFETKASPAILEAAPKIQLVY